MKKTILPFILVLLFSTGIYAENPTETIRKYAESQTRQLTAHDIAAHFNAAMTDPVFGSGSTYVTGSHSYLSIAVLDDTHFVVVYDQTDGKARVGEVSGLNIVTYGAEVTFGTETANQRYSVSSLDATHFVVAYRSGNSGARKIRAIVGEVSGTTIQSFGTSTVLYDPSNSNLLTDINVVALDASYFTVVFKEFSSGGKAVVGEVSGTSIASFGSIHNFDSSSGVSDVAVAKLDATHFVIAYEDENDAGFNGKAKIGQISGTSASFGGANTFESQFADDIDVTVLDDSRFVIVYEDWNNSNFATAIVGQRSGTSISGFGSTFVYKSQDLESQYVTALSSTQFVVAYKDGTYKSMIGDVSGTTITGFGNEVEIDNSTGIFPNMALEKLDNNGKFGLIFQNASSGNGVGIVGGIPSNNLEVSGFTAGSNQVCLNQTTSFQTVGFGLPTCDANTNATYTVTVTPTGQGVTGAVSGTGTGNCSDASLDITTTSGATPGNYAVSIALVDSDGITNTTGMTPIFSNATTLVFSLGTIEVLNDVDVQAITGGAIEPGSTETFDVNIVHTNSTTTYDWTVAGTALNQMTGDGASTGAAVSIDVGGGNMVEASATTSNITTGATESILTLTNTPSGLTQSFSVSLQATNPCNSDTETATNTFIALPIELKYFRGHSDGKQARLEWATVAELDNDYFTIERSFTGEDFEPVGEIKGAGTSYALNTYFFIDDISGQAIDQVFYRLKQTDFDGESSNSEIIIIDIKKSSNFDITSVFADQNDLSVNFVASTDNDIRAIIYNLNGQQLYENTYSVGEGLNTLMLGISDLASGLYVIHLMNGQKRVSRKFVKP